MRKIERLIKEAVEAATFRGHSLPKQWVKAEPGKPGPKQTAAWNQCERCGASVTVIVNPLPNQIDIGGNVVAVGCRKE